MTEQKITYKCKLCPFITYDKKVALSHVREHFADVIEEVSVEDCSQQIKEIGKGFNHKKVRPQPTESTLIHGTLDIDNSQEEPLSAESIRKIAEFLPTPTPEPLLLDTSYLTDSRPTIAAQSIAVDTSKQETMSIISNGGYKSQCTYKCICSPGCHYIAKKLKKLIGHVLTVHYPDKTEEWVMSHFSSLFKECAPIPVVPPKKRHMVTPQSYTRSSGYRQPSYTWGESGIVYQSRVNRDFDYDLDGRVK